jgi:hypothetical protein
MKAIKFRGRTPDGKWVYGDLHIRTIHPHIHTEPCSKAIIDSNTVGQFIGLYDINDKEIYFGDIVRNKYGDIGKIVWFHDCSIRVDWGGDDIHFMDPDLGLEVIGNIFDNPELIKSL